MSAYPMNTWTHVAVVRNGDNWTLYVGGSSVDSVIASDAVPDISKPFRIAEDTYGPHDFPGYIDEFRISKGVARWTSNFTPPTEPYSEEQGVIPEVNSGNLTKIFILLIVALLVGALLLKNSKN